MEIFSINSLISLYAIYIIIDKLYQFIYFIYSSFIRKEVNLIKRYETKENNEQWVFITGPTEGIGREFAYEFASKGFNLVLCSRNESKLKELQQLLSIKFTNLKTKLVVCDFASFPYDFNSYEKLFNDYFKSNNITILVNNVGVIIRGLMSDIKIESVYETIKVNILPQLYLSKMFIQSRNNKKGGIISISSISCEGIKNNCNLYLSTKLFNKYLSKGLHLEEPELDVLCVKPSLVSTKMAQINPDSKFVITAKECVFSIFKEFVHEYDTYGSWKHKIRSFHYKLFPERQFFEYYSKKKVSS